MLGRYLLQDTLSGLLKGKSKRWEMVDKAIEMEGWKLLVLLRLSPLVPYNLLNIAMAATKIPFWSFATASCFGSCHVQLHHPIALAPAPGCL